MKNDIRKPRKPMHVAFTIAQRVVVQGQRLRADETMTATTFNVALAAPRLAVQR